MLWSQIADTVGVAAFLAGMRDLTSRAAGPGVGADLFLEAVETIGGRGLRDRSASLLAGAPLPSLEYTTAIDRGTGEVLVEFAHTGEVTPVTVPVQIHVRDAQAPVVHRVLIDAERKSLRITPQGKPVRIEVDPMGAALVRKLKKVRRLADPPENR